ncbi:hypothetical protein KBD69_02295 [Candidatus Woesebacteria bacterium]|nr:hypothetical protein [Candidatus Woesebacteria bacterium]
MKKKITRTKAKVSKRIKSKSTSLSPLPLILVLALIIISGYYVYRSLLSSSSTPIQIAEIKNATGSVNLNLNSTKTSLAPNQDATVTLTYDSPTDKLTVISGEISYDPAVLTVSNFVKGDGFPTEFAAATAANGKITFTYGVAVAAGSGLTGQGNILTFKVRSKAVGSSTLAITDATQVLVTGNSNNALREITNTTVAVADPAVSPSTAASAAVSPSPSTTVTVSPSPAVSPSAAASIIPSTPASASPIASVPVVQKPAAPTNLVYNCYSDGKRITLRWNAVANVDSYEVVFDQKDGDNDQTKSATRAEIDLDIKNNTNYKWSVVSVKDGVKSDASSVNDIKCSGDVAQAATPTPTPTPTTTPTPTPAPTKKPITEQIAGIFKPKSPSPTPTPKPTLAPTDFTTPNQNSNVIATPTPTPGSLGDIFTSPSATPVVAANTNNTSFFSKILLGWQALFIRFIETLTN